MAKGKPICKADLQAALGLPKLPDVPLLGFVGRLTHQKGVDLIAEIIPEWAEKTSVQWAILGKGESVYHDMFRDLGGILTGAIADYREGRKNSIEFARFFAPRLNFFLGNLDGHHNVEDHHYFPVFAKAERRLARGFEVLDADHYTIHAALDRNAESANAFIRALQESEDRQR